MQKVRLGSALAILLVVLCALFLRKGANRPRPLGRPATLLASINTSGSSANELPPSKEFVVSAAMALPAGTRLVIDRFDRRTENVFEGPVPADEDDLLSTVGPRLKVRSGLDDTLTDLLVARAEQVVRAARGPVAVAILGDGYSEGVTPAGHAAIRAAAARLAADPKFVGLYVVGAEPAARAQIRQDFAPLGSRLAFMELSDDPSAIADALEAAR